MEGVPVLLAVCVTVAVRLLVPVLLCDAVTEGVSVTLPVCVALLVAV